MFTPDCRLGGPAGNARRRTPPKGVAQNQGSPRKSRWTSGHFQLRRVQQVLRTCHPRRVRFAAVFKADTGTAPRLAQQIRDGLPGTTVASRTTARKSGLGATPCAGQSTPSSGRVAEQASRTPGGIVRSRWSWACGNHVALWLRRVEVWITAGLGRWRVRDGAIHQHHHQSAGGTSARV